MPENPAAKKTEDPFGSKPASATGHSSGGANNSLNGFDEVLIKAEPESGGSTPACVQSPPLSGNSTAGSKAPPNSLPFPSSSSAMSCSNGRFGRSFSTPDAKRRCPGTNNRSSPLLEDENDLKLKPYDFLNNVIKTPPIKPLEEGDDPPITPSPTSMGPLLRRSSSNPPTNNSCTSNHSNHSNHSNPPSTPTGNGICSANNISTSSSSSQMEEDLYEFYRVMEQVCEQKGRLSSAPGTSGNITTATISTSGATSTQIDMYSGMSPPPGVVNPGSGSAIVPPSQRIISPPPYNATSTGALPQTLPLGPGHYRGNGQQLQRAVLTSPPGHTAVSPPFTAADARSLYNRSLVGQQPHTPLSLNLQQQRQQGQAYSTAVTHTSLPSSQVNLPLQFSSDHSSLHTQQSPHHQPGGQQAQVIVGGKPLESQQRTGPPLTPHQSMQLSHLNQGLVSCPTVATPTPLTSHMYYNGSSSSQSAQQRTYTSAPLSLTPHPPAPPQQQTQQTPLTPTTPLEHFSFQTSQNSRISPTHCPTNPLCHPGSLGTYTTFSDASHYLSNHVQTPCLPARGHQQTIQMPQQHQNSGGLTVSTNSWAQRRLPAQQLPNMMTQHTAMMSRNQMGSLPRMQVPSQASSLSMSSYQLNQRMSHLSSLQHHTVPAPPPAYLQSCGSSAHPNNPAAFSGLPFP